MILKKLKTKTFTVEDFHAVNRYFSIKWDDSDFSKYIRPSTLYNEKFGDKVDEATHAEKDLKSTLEDTKDVANYYFTKFKSIYQIDIKKENNMTLFQIAWLLNRDSYSVPMIKGIIDGFFAQQNIQNDYNKSMAIPNKFFGASFKTLSNRFKQVESINSWRQK